MSTKQTIRINHADTEARGYHVYTDTLDAEGSLVYLELTGVEAEMSFCGGILQVTIALPGKTALELGLVTAGDFA